MGMDLPQHVQNLTHSVILSQQTSGRWQLAGGGQVQNQPSQQVQDSNDIMTEKNCAKGLMYPLSLLYITNLMFTALKLF